MAKIPSKYIETVPFSIIERGYHKEKNMVSESLFSLGNEYQGIRGFFDEGVSLPSLQGVYFNGVYEYSREETKNAYLGIVKRTHFMINSVNWVKTKLIIDDQTLDLHTAVVEDYVRELHFKSGILSRSFTWVLGTKKIQITFERFLSMVECKRAFQRIQIRSNEDCDVQLTLSLDSNVLHWGDHCYYDRVLETSVDETTFLLNVVTPTTKQKVSSAMMIQGAPHPQSICAKDREIRVNYGFKLPANETKTIDRFVVNHVDKRQEKAFPVLNHETLVELMQSAKEGYSANVKKQKAYWENYFAEHDIILEGDEENQQGIRYCLFQLQQTYHGYDPSNNIGAKGLTGEAYSGHAFWDTETYCLSYYLLNNITAAKNLLLYRYQTLQKAKERAKMLDCQGACYPIATLNGEESCNLWQHASLQFQPSTGVAFAIFHYCNITKDIEFLRQYGFEMLIEISKFMLSRGDFTEDRTKFGYYCVMGPDEFQMMVNHNTYTNYLAKRTFQYTREVANMLSEQDRIAIMEKCGVNLPFFEDIKEAEEKMVILYDEKSKLFEQHDGYFKLPHVDVDKIPVSEFPLYHHWSYDRIYRNDMIKQPDVLMFLFLYNQSFTFVQKKKNYEFYEPRCIHESSLSPSVHSILACEINRIDEALQFFGFATRLDLDDYNRNTCEGLHTTSIAAAWSNIVYGFGGIRTDGSVLKIDPKIPSSWKGYSFHLTYRNSLIFVKVTQKGYQIVLKRGRPVSVQVHNQVILLSQQYDGEFEYEEN